MSYQKDWKIADFVNMINKDVKEIAYSWILSELNPVKGKNIWKSQDQSIEA